MNIYEYCTKVRKEHGVSQKDIADNLGYTQRNISAFEHGKNRNMYILAWYMLYFGISIDEMRCCDDI